MSHTEKTDHQKDGTTIKHFETGLDPALLHEAHVANAKEHEMPVWQGLKSYRKAVIWSLLLSAAVIMEGYDTILIGSFLAFPSFINTFANQAAVGGASSITAPWQSAIANGAYIGEILGLAVAGWLCDLYGNKKTMGVATATLIATIFISVFGKTLPLQLVGQILCGIPWGIFQTLPVVYASEVLPTHLRGYLTSYVNLCWVVGQLIASGVLVAFQNREDSLGWQIPYMIQWAWPIPIIAVCILCPESPVWLVKKGRIERAERAVQRLQNSNAGANIATPSQVVALHVETDVIEKELTHDVGYLECFRGVNLRRTEISVVTWTAQQMCGPVLQTFSVFFFVQAGLSSEQSFNMNLGLYGIAFVGTVLSWPLINRFGRRTIYLGGLIGCFITLLVTGLLGIAPMSNTSASWAIGALLLVYTFIYDSTIGPLTYVIVSESPSSRLRTKTTVLARNAYNITCIWTGVLSPYMLNTTAWNWGAYAALFWAGCTAIVFVWAYFRLPEYKGLTFKEIDLLFAAGTPARKFSKAREAPSGERIIVGKEG